MPTRHGQPLALLIVLAVLLGHIAQVLHRVAHVHVYCAQHDRVEHAGHGEGWRGCKDGPAQPADERDEGHEVCPFLPPGLSTGEQPAPPERVQPVARAGEPPAPRQPLYAETLWLLAPKHSPPVLV